MDTWQGRMGNPTTLNKYLYADGSPTMYVDPTGQFSLGGMMSGINMSMTLYSTASATYNLFEGYATGDAEIDSKAVGIAVLTALGGKKLMRILSSTCKKRRQCNYIKGFTEAELKIRTMVSSIPNRRLNKRAKPWKVATIAGAYDIKRGRGTAATNGPVRYDNKLAKHARKFGLSLGQRGACGTHFTVGRCAEWRAASNLTRSGSRVKYIRWTLAYNVKKGANGFAELAGVRSPCGICDEVGFSP